MSQFESLAAFLGAPNTQSEPWVDPAPNSEQWAAYVVVRRGPIEARLRVKLAQECVASALETHWQLEDSDPACLRESLATVGAWLQNRTTSAELDRAFDEDHYAPMEDMVDEAEGFADDAASASVIRSVMELCSAAKITARAEAGEQTDVDLEVAATFAAQAVLEARDSAWANLEGDEEADAARVAEEARQAELLAARLLDAGWTATRAS